MNKVSLILICISFLFSYCSKIEKTKKRLDGTWNAVSYQYTTNLGFSYFYDTEGIIEFENCDEDTCSYSIDLNYSNSTDSGTKSEFGNYIFIDEEGEYFSLYRIGINGVDILDSGRIILITNSDLKIEYVDNIGRHIYTLEK